jgi:hexokinase
MVRCLTRYARFLTRDSHSQSILTSHLQYPHFKARGAQALKEILDWESGRDGKALGKGHDPVEIMPAEDGSGVGAALIAALTLKRVQEGNTAGIRDPEGMLKAIAKAKA